MGLTATIGETMADGADLREDVAFSRLVSYQTSMDLMWTKVRGIFRWEGLPLTVPHRHLERYLTQNGHAVFYEVDGQYFVTDAKPHAKPDCYGDFTEVSIEHRVDGIPQRLTRTIGIDAVLIRNDPDQIGLEPLLNEYSILQSQAKISILRVLQDIRSHYVLQAKDENSYESALKYEEAIRRGDIAVILAEELDTMEGLAVHQTPVQGNPAQAVIELTQYIQSMYYSELGISLNNNMKRSYVSDAELEQTSGGSLVAVMLNSRELAARDIKALFDLGLEVAISEQWNNEQEQNPEEGTDEEPPSDGTDDEAEGATDPDADPDAAEEAEGDDAEEAPDADADADGDDDAGELEDVSRDELIEATGAMLGEEVETHDEENDGDTDPRGGDPED